MSRHGSGMYQQRNTTERALFTRDTTLAKSSSDFEELTIPCPDATHDHQSDKRFAESGSLGVTAYRFRDGPIRDGSGMPTPTQRQVWTARSPRDVQSGKSNTLSVGGTVSSCGLIDNSHARQAGDLRTLLFGPPAAALRPHLRPGECWPVCSHGRQRCPIERSPSRSAAKIRR
jgi:hypothetical protein